MAKLMDFRVSVPGDDAVKAEAVKAILLDTIRKMGAHIMTADQAEGETLTEPPTAFFSAASVKTFVIQSTRPAKSAAKGKP